MYLFRDERQSKENHDGNASTESDSTFGGVLHAERLQYVASQTLDFGFHLAVAVRNLDPDALVSGRTPR
jgi:hypothetical protein